MILDSLKLDGKIAVVTGAGRGLGRAMAVKFAEAGADIVAASRTREQLEQTAREVEQTGRKCLIVPTDVTNSQQVNAMAAEAIKKFGRIDILINNAGGGDESAAKPIEQITDDEWRRGIDTNLTSQFYACRAVLPQMVKQKRGKIINLSSGYGLRGGKHNYMYVCSKGGVIQFTRSLALTYAQHNIQSNCIVPGVFPHAGANEQLMQFFKGGKFIPVGRLGEDDELGPLAIFLASDASNHINGEFIAIDGGGLAGGISPTGVVPQSN
jgi:NAD(P)-dependent dehydrogenase (short-subunit alcohol dehydrogenase family)